MNALVRFPRWGVAIVMLAAAVWAIDLWRPFDGRTRASWREADDAAIARNFYREGMNVLYPRIDWRGNGPGFAEMEFPFLPWSMAAAYHVTGVRPEVGRVVAYVVTLVGLVAFLAFAADVLPPIGVAAAGLLWAKVVGSTMALARALLDRGDRDAVRRLAGFLAEAGEGGAATDLKIALGKAVWATHREPLQDISNTMRPAAIGTAIDALRAVLLEVPEDYPDRNREVNRFLAPLAASVHAIMRAQEIAIPYGSRLEHIAAGGVAKYPDIVKLSLDEIAAEFEGLCNRPGNE